MERPQSALLFAVAALTIYVVAIMPALERHGFDVSTFVVAGEQECGVGRAVVDHEDFGVVDVKR